MKARCRPSLCGCRLFRTVRASIEVIHVRRAVSGPGHLRTAGREYAGSDLAAGQSLVCLSPVILFYRRFLSLASDIDRGSRQDASLGHLSRRYTTAGHPRLCSSHKSGIPLSVGLDLSASSLPSIYCYTLPRTFVGLTGLLRSATLAVVTRQQDTRVCARHTSPGYLFQWV